MARDSSPIGADLMRAAATGALPRRELVRRGLQAGLGLAAVTALALMPRAAARKATPIPPNCIFVCCDGTCDKWDMCLKCVTWPDKKPSLIAQGSDRAAARRASRRRKRSNRHG